MALLWCGYPNEISRPHHFTGRRWGVLFAYRASVAQQRFALDGTAMNSVRRGILMLEVPGMVATAGCVCPTVSLHSFRDVAVTITEAGSDRPVPHLPFRVVYDYAPADSPIVYHV
jgi:hypothetical protein